MQGPEDSAAYSQMVQEAANQDTAVCQSCNPQLREARLNLWLGETHMAQAAKQIPAAGVVGALRAGALLLLLGAGRLARGAVAGVAAAGAAAAFFCFLGGCVYVGSA